MLKLKNNKNFFKTSKFNFILLVSLLLISIFFIITNTVYSANESGNLDVQMIVPASSSTPPDTGGPSGPSDTTPPTIDSIIIIPNFTTSSIYWKATDTSGIGSCYFDYGLTELYGNSATPINNLENFNVDLDNLTTSTLYYFKITCSDTYGNTAVTSSIFNTLSDEFSGDLLIKAHPEKRIFKAEGNLILNATLLLINPINKNIVYTKDISLNSSGDSTFTDFIIPIGNFEAVLKGESHLAKRIINVSIEDKKDNFLDFTDADTFSLLAGDVQGSGLKDNFVDVLDISATNINFNSKLPVFDLNRDGIVDVLDLSMILVNFNKSGDPI